ncbi:uncharacterized protein PgNI_11770 [Pyricularia grisea]|uniref:Uncharacterized protein n=1 Tax=Pyricularia grisea TaxID=148305 RepID=A0A6P8AP21_PYRGI|nr:uncharacterized protein PgNI_11770 [Pyricularia grisea]TLD03780.1 hypothetical protein PgNI_11770 [Pyricularia grisea]
MLLLVELGFANTFCSAVSIKAMWLRVSYVSLPSTICLNNAFKPTPRSSQTSMSGFPPIEPFPLLKKTPRAPTWHRETTPEIIGLIFHFILGLSLGGNELSETKKKKKKKILSVGAGGSFGFFSLLLHCSSELPSSNPKERLTSIDGAQKQVINLAIQ